MLLLVLLLFLLLLWHLCAVLTLPLQPGLSLTVVIAPVVVAKKLLTVAVVMV
jgi:hypothetical protein